MKNTQQTERNNYIDFLRGIAAVAIVFIHTCFWSGGNYVPEFMQTLSLAIDVPFFFFLSGWSAAYVNSFEKGIVSVLNVYKKYVMFFPFYIIALLLVGAITGQYPGLTLQNLYGNLFFLAVEQSTLPIVMGSMWFMPVYLVVVPLGRFLTMKVFGNEKQGILLLITGLGLLYSYWTGSFFHISSQTLFYLFFYFLGMVCKDIRINRFRTVVLFGIVDITAMKLLGIYFGWNVSNMQSMKFPPSIIYLLYSLLGICAALWGKSKFQAISTHNVLCRIGRSAILFYFCQGISSSLLCYIMPRIVLHWEAKLLIAFAINLTGTIILVMILNLFFKIENRLAFQLRSAILDVRRAHRN